MRIAYFHNIPTGGAKRAAFEQARGLKANGHSIAVFTPASARDSEVWSLQKFGDGFQEYGEKGDAPMTAPAGEADAVLGALRRLRGTALFDLSRDYRRLQRQEREAARLSALYREMARDIARGGFDLLFAHTCYATLAPDLLRFVRAARPDLPVVFYCHDTLRRVYEWSLAPDAPGDARRRRSALHRDTRGQPTTAIARYAARLEEQRYIANTRAAGMTLANSCYSREGLLRTTGVNARVCYPGVDADFFSPDDAPRTGEVLSVGALVWNKRHDLILDAVALLPVACRPRLRIIGYDPTGAGRIGAARQTLGPEGERLRARARDRAVDLLIDQNVSDESLRAAYRRASVVAFAPYLEPFGLVAIEAMACGTPVVAVAEAGPRESVVNGVTGLLTDGAAGSVADALHRVLGSPALARTLGEQARTSVLEKWTWARSNEVLNGLLIEAKEIKSL